MVGKCSSPLSGKKSRENSALRFLLESVDLCKKRKAGKLIPMCSTSKHLGAESNYVYSILVLLGREENFPKFSTKKFV